MAEWTDQERGEVHERWAALLARWEGSDGGRPSFVDGAGNPPVWERPWPTVIAAHGDVDMVATLRGVPDARNPDGKIFFNGEWV